MDEQDFFDAVGLDGAIAPDGLTDARADECNGWTYAIPNMAKYNAQNIAYLSDDQYPDALRKYGICLIWTGICFTRRGPQILQYFDNRCKNASRLLFIKAV